MLACVTSVSAIEALRESWSESKTNSPGKAWHVGSVETSIGYYILANIYPLSSATH